MRQAVNFLVDCSKLSFLSFLLFRSLLAKRVT
jgi:hypothetical protein